MDVLVAQDLEEAGGVFARAVVEGEGDDLRPEGPLVSSPVVPPVQPTTRTGRRRKARVPVAGRLSWQEPLACATAVTQPVRPSTTRQR